MVACRMNENFDHHIPVLLNEVIAALITVTDGVYVDATFGRGSHTQAILEKLGPNATLIAFDKDPEAVQYAKVRFSKDKRFKIFHCSYAEMEKILIKENVMCKVNGILFDLGTSSPQLDNPNRGFSFMQAGKLDMRMDNSQGEDAATWLAKASEAEIAQVLWQYGEEKQSRRIARAIVNTRSETPITTTSQLAEIISRVLPPVKKYSPRPIKHPATRSFQAIRIHINRELTELEAALAQAYQALAKHGRLAVISFHSLEDRIVKQFIRQHEKGSEIPRGLPIKGAGFDAQLKSIGKPIKASDAETNINPRARSATLRIAEKLL